MWHQFFTDPRSVHALQRFSFTALLIAFFTIISRPPDWVDLASALCGMNGMIVAALAWLRGELVQAPHLTRWDEAASFLLIHHGASAFLG